MNFLVGALFILFIFFINGCDSHGDKGSNKTKRLKGKATSQNTDTLLNNNDTLVIRDSTGGIDTFLKFNSKIFGEEFRVANIQSIKTPHFDFSSSNYGSMYKTTIKNSVDKYGANFSGQYTFAFWGCGSPCKMSAIIDLVTGKVYDGPTACYGYSFAINSRVIQVNPCDNGEWYKSNRTCGAPEEFVWDRTGFKLLSTKHLYPRNVPAE